MPSEITRRRLLRNSALVSGGALLVGFDLHGAPSARAAADADGSDAGGGRSDGVFAQIEYGDSNDDFLVQWTRAGGSSSLQLTPTSVRIDVPTLGAGEIALADFEQGRAEHEIARYFGHATLEQLRNEVAHLLLFPGL